MTIDSQWIAALKRDIPLAFTPTPPFVPDAIFCDGQIRLMSPVTEEIRTWDDYIHQQYERYLSNCFGSGVATVILAFDDYNHVPVAKAMTQTKRRSKVPQVNFADRDCLPPCVPAGDEWAHCICNRAFKTKVIHLVTHTLGVRTAHTLSPGQALIIDWQGHPVRYTSDALPDHLTDLEWLGESDVKFARYAEMFPALQVDSIDGDSIPIALLKMEAGFTGNFSVLRMHTRVDPLPKKRLVTGEPAQPRTPAKRVFEYVDIRKLHQGILKHVIPRKADRRHAISMLVALIGLTGTDFTRGLPLVSGKTVYEMLPELWPGLTQAHDSDEEGLVSGYPAALQGTSGKPGCTPSCTCNTEGWTLKPEVTPDALVARIYQIKFHSHVTPGPYAAVSRQIAASKLGERTKAAIPSQAVLECTARNVNWLLTYWRQLAFPDPVQPRFGYVRRRGVVGHAD